MDSISQPCCTKLMCTGQWYSILLCRCSWGVGCAASLRCGTYQGYIAPMSAFISKMVVTSWCTVVVQFALCTCTVYTSTLITTLFSLHNETEISWKFYWPISCLQNLLNCLLLVSCSAWNSGYEYVHCVRIKCKFHYHYSYYGRCRWKCPLWHTLT